MKSLARTAILSIVLAAAGCAGWIVPFRAQPEKAPDLRFVTRSDLGLPDGQLALDVVYTIHPGIRLDPMQARWSKEDIQPGYDPVTAFRALTQNVMAETFHTAVETAPGLHARIEDLRRSLLSQEKGSKDLPALGARALILVDFRPSDMERPDIPSQLSVKVYDISFDRYEELSLYNPRLLIFEDFAEVVPPEGPAKLPGALLLAWREVFFRMRTSARFQRYLDLGSEAIDSTQPSGAILLGIVPADHIAKTPDPRSHEWIEDTFLFPKAQLPSRAAWGSGPPESASAPIASPAAAQGAAPAPQTTGDCPSGGALRDSGPAGSSMSAPVPDSEPMSSVQEGQGR